MPLPFVDPNQRRRTFEDPTDNLREVHRNLPHESDKGARRVALIGFCVGVLFLAGVLVLTSVVGNS
jgi:hypothetical protein